MSTEYEEEKNAFEKEIIELVRLVFEKAKKDSRATTKNACGNFIEENSELKSKTFIRMYDRYVMGDQSQPIPQLYSLNSAAEFIGFKSFAEFCNKFFPVEEKEEINNEVNPPKNISANFKKKIVGIGIASFLSLGSYFGFSALNQPECMIWDKSHYKAIYCDENVSPNVAVIPIDQKLLKHFHKIEVSDTTTFFEAGKAIVWYIKIDGEVEFYSMDGVHPLNGRELKKVTPYIVNKYVLNP